MDRISRFFEKLDRSLFLDEAQKKYAQVDAPLPIGMGQTISQPSLVVQMTRLLELDKDKSVLEVGTGSGYQTAFLAEFSKQVYTIELLKELSLEAQQRLEELGYDNISFKVGDGSEGWPEKAPFDRIVVTAAAGRYPEKLIEQLADNGRMIVPIGPRYSQELVLIEKDGEGRVREKSLMGVVFVEFKGEYGF